MIKITIIKPQDQKCGNCGTKFVMGKHAWHCPACKAIYDHMKENP